MTHLYNKWSLEEKKRLASLLELYPLHSYQSIANRIGTKDGEEVQNFIQKMESQALHKTNNYARPAKLEKDPPKPPLEDWLTLCSGLVEAESFDTSSHLSKVMSIIAHFEDFPVPDDMPPVDYPKIYRFLSQILQWDRLEDVSPLESLESSVLLDMLHSLMDTLCTKDLTVQKTVMQWKCKLLDNTEEEPAGCSKTERLKKVAENDYAEFIAEEEKKWAERLMAASKEETAEAEERQKQAEDEAEDTPQDTIVEKSSYVFKKEEPDTDEANKDLETEKDKRTEDPNLISMTTASGSIYTYQRSWKHKPGRKKKEAVPETPITEIVIVKPPENVKIIKPAPRKKNTRNERPDGKWAMKKVKELKEIAETTSGVIDLTEITSKPANLDDIHIDDPKTPLTSVRKHKPKKKPKRDSGEPFDVLMKRYEGYKRKYEQVQEGACKMSKKKPKLYTINPFCVPVSLLDLDT